jgi:DNA (cytosine-5)-methyltransferase 1
MTWKRWAMPSGPPICALRALAHRTSGSGSTGGGVRLVDPNGEGPQGRGGDRDRPDQRAVGPPGLGWRDGGWVQCADGRSRPTAPIARRVDDGVPARVGLLRGYGNAIVPEVAAAFLTALLQGLAPPVPLK